MGAFFTAAPTVCFAFSSMFQLFEVFAAMRRTMMPNEALPRMKQVVVCSGMLVTALYVSVALACITAFGKHAGVTNQGNGYGNALYNFSPDNYAVTICCVLLVVAIVLDYPIINMPLVNAVLRIESPCMYCRFARQAVSIFFAVIVILVDMAVPDLPDVFGLCGALGVSNFCYIAPGFVLLCRGSSPFARLVGGVSALLGLAMLFGSTTFIVRGIISKHGLLADAKSSLPNGYIL